MIIAINYDMHPWCKPQCPYFEHREQTLMSDTFSGRTERIRLYSCDNMEICKNSVDLFSEWAEKKAKDGDGDG